MQKVPTLFVRDPADRSRVTDEITPGCEWVLRSEGTATRKYDGTCVMFDGTDWWARREVKEGKAQPPGYQPITYDENTGKTVGWEPIEQSPFVKAFRTADHPLDLPPGTYELCGPKINSNPEGYATHRLIRHTDAERVLLADFTGLPEFTVRAVLEASVKTARTERGWEGIVWHHPDGRMAKLKARDFR